MDDPRITRYASEHYVREFVNETITNAGTGGIVNLEEYVKKVDGKGLSTNDLTDALKKSYDSAVTHSTSTHAPSNAQKNSDITKAEIENKLTGDISTHSHSKYALNTSLPTKVSQLENDSNFLTEHQSLAGLATETFVNTKVAALVDSAPEALDTLKELSTALGNDPNFATTVATNIGGKVDKQDGMTLTHNDLTDALKTSYDNAVTHASSNHAPANAQKNSDITKAEIETKLTGDISTHSHSAYDAAVTHASSAHAPSNAQKNSDITKSEIEAKLTGDIGTHSHSIYATKIYVRGLALAQDEISEIIFEGSDTDPSILTDYEDYAGGTAYKIDVQFEYPADGEPFPYRVTVGKSENEIYHVFEPADFSYNIAYNIACFYSKVNDYNEIYIGKNDSGQLMMTYNTMTPAYRYMKIEKIEQPRITMKEYIDTKVPEGTDLTEAQDSDIIAMLTEVLGGDYSGQS